MDPITVVPNLILAERPLVHKKTAEYRQAPPGTLRQTTT